MKNLGYIAERLRKARVKLGLTQDVAAVKCGISIRTLRSYEKNGIRDILALERICKCYGITITIRVGN
jgi:transcriptional regulator with XRE-family HTH domain